MDETKPSQPPAALDTAADSEEPVREKLEETTISPVEGRAESQLASLDGEMAVTTRAQAAKQKAEGGAGEESAGLQGKKRGREEEESKDSEDVGEGKSNRKRAVTTTAGEGNAAKPPGQEAAEDIELEEADEPESTAQVTTNGSREATTPPPMEDATMLDKTPGGVSSPNNKRSRSQFLRDAADSSPAKPESAAAPVPADVAAPVGTAAKSEGEPAAKRQKSESPPRDKVGAAAAEKTSSESTPKVPATSGFANTSSASPFAAMAKSPAKADTKTSTLGGFANTSSASPFGSLASPKPASSTSEPEKPQPTTSTSAFASSGFGALAKASSSPFGSLSSKPSSAASPFASSLGSTGGFGSSSIGSSGGGGFGALGAGSSKLGSFASGSSSAPGGSLPPITGLSQKPAKPFGAPADEPADEDEGSGAEDAELAAGIKSPGSNGDEHASGNTNTAAAGAGSSAPTKLEPVHVETGEENETTLFSCRAKLYAFVKPASGEGKPEWRERGKGTLKVNSERALSASSASGAPPKTRILMRAEGTNRLLMNSPVGLNTLSGEKPKGGITMLFLGQLPERGGLHTLQVKTKSVNELWDTVHDIQEELELAEAELAEEKKAEAAEEKVGDDAV